MIPERLLLLAGTLNWRGPRQSLLNSNHIYRFKQNIFHVGRCNHQVRKNIFIQRKYFISNKHTFSVRHCSYSIISNLKVLPKLASFSDCSGGKNLSSKGWKRYLYCGGSKNYLVFFHIKHWNPHGLDEDSIVNKSQFLACFIYLWKSSSFINFP